MTKKDYIKLAAVINKNYTILTKPDNKFTVWLIAKDLCRELQQDNPLFDYNKFMKACGMPS